MKHPIEIVKASLQNFLNTQNIREIEKVLREKINDDIVQYFPSSDKNVVMQCVKENGECLGYASDELRDDKEVVLTAVNTSLNGLKYASVRLQDDDEIVFSSTKKYPHSLRYASDRLKHTKELVLRALRLHGASYAQYVPPDLLKDEEVALKLVSTINQHCDKLHYLPEFQDNREFCLKAVQADYGSYNSVSLRFKEDLSFNLEVLNYFSTSNKPYAMTPLYKMMPESTKKIGGSEITSAAENIEKFLLHEKLENNLELKNNKKSVKI